MGTVFLVVLIHYETYRRKGIYACKIVYEEYLKEKNEETRRTNLQREIDLLRETDKKTSVTLIELI